MDSILIQDLEVFYRVGITNQERAQPQRLLLCIDLRRDLSLAAAKDDLRETIDYAEVAQDLLGFGETRNWNLLEKLASDIAEMVLARYCPASVTVQVKKFVIPQARYVSVAVTRPSA